MSAYKNRNKYTRPVCLRIPNDLAAKVNAYTANGGPTISPLVQALISTYFNGLGTIPPAALGFPDCLPTQKQIDQAAIDMAAKRGQSPA